MKRSKVNRFRGKSKHISLMSSWDRMTSSCLVSRAWQSMKTTKAQKYRKLRGQKSKVNRLGGGGGGELTLFLLEILGYDGISHVLKVAHS